MLLVLWCGKQMVVEELCNNTLAEQEDNLEKHSQKISLQLALQLHPDKNNDPGAEDAFKEVSISDHIRADQRWTKPRLQHAECWSRIHALTHPY